MFSDGLNIFGFDDNGSNSANESSPNEEFNDSSEHFSANELSASKKMAPGGVSYPQAPEEVFKQGHMIHKKNIHPTNSKLA